MLGVRGNNIFYAEWLAWFVLILHLIVCVFVIQITTTCPILYERPTKYDNSNLYENITDEQIAACRQII